MPPPLPANIRADVLRRARLGETFDAIAETTGVSKGAISTACKKAGIAVRSRGARGASARAGPRRAAPALTAQPGPTKTPAASAPAGGKAGAGAKGKSTASPAAKKGTAPMASNEAEGGGGLEPGDEAGEQGPLYDPETLAGVDLEELDLSALEALEKGAASLLNTPDIRADARLFVHVGDFITRLRTSMHRLRPSPKLDPDLDPTNVHARQTVLDRVRGMVGAARGRAAALEAAGSEPTG